MYVNQTLQMIRSRPNFTTFYILFVCCLVLVKIGYVQHQRNLKNKMPKTDELEYSLPLPKWPNRILSSTSSNDGDSTSTASDNVDLQQTFTIRSAFYDSESQTIDILVAHLCNGTMDNAKLWLKSKFVSQKNFKKCYKFSDDLKGVSLKGSEQSIRTSLASCGKKGKSTELCVYGLFFCQSTN